MSKKNTIVPFFSRRIDIKLGLNNLGIRNAAENLFTTLLPGLNNVSSRIRYYSFYCWIIRHFYDGRSKASDKEFNTYIRHAEYLLALIHSFVNQSQGIPGRLFTDKIIFEQPHAEAYSISQGTDRQPSYWANPGGIFRQYYSVSLFESGLIASNNANLNLYNITKDSSGQFITGEQMADSFAESIGAEAEQEFLSCIEDDEVTPNQLRRLREPFYMRNVNSKPLECELLTRLLLQKDAPARETVLTAYRQQTLRYYLRFVTTQPADLSGQGFARWMYDHYLAGDFTDDTAAGWYDYYLNDQWQYLVTIIFSRLLDDLKAYGTWMPIEQLRWKVAEEMLGGQTIHDILQLVHVNKERLQQVDDIFHLPGRNFSNFSRFVLSNSQLTEMQFAEKFVDEQLIYQHYIVSFQKQQATGLASQKFILENDRLLYVGDYGATHTSPRIDTVRGFLEDLGLIANGALTPAGEKLLNTAAA